MSARTEGEDEMSVSQHERIHEESNRTNRNVHVKGETDSSLIRFPAAMLSNKRPTKIFVGSGSQLRSTPSVQSRKSCAGVLHVIALLRREVMCIFCKFAIYLLLCFTLATTSLASGRESPSERERAP